MLCEHCSEREATVHLTQVIDGEVKKLHLCEECAAESGFDVHGTMSVTDVLLGMGGQMAASPPPAESIERSCPVCHLRRSDFKKTGQFGCPACYETFSDELKPLLKAIRGVAAKFRRLADRGKRIPPDQHWYRTLYDQKGNQKGYLLGHGQRMRTVYTPKMNPKGTKI